MIYEGLMNIALKSFRVKARIFKLTADSQISLFNLYFGDFRKFHFEFIS